MSSDTVIRFARPINRSRQKIALIRAPFFSPLSPPLGISMLKAYLQQNGHIAKCYDFNVDPILWETQKKYFSVVERSDQVIIKDGYSRLWALINAHLHAYMAGANRDVCIRIIRTVGPLFGFSIDTALADELQLLVKTFFRRLTECTEALDLSDFSFVGTSTYTTSLAPSLYVLRQLKQRYRFIKTVMGGGVFADDLALGSENLDILLQKFDFLDHAVLGEGELLLLRLIEGAFNHKRVITIADLDGEKLDIGALPAPDFSDFSLKKYFHLTIEGGRSCPFQCSFCSETIQWGDYRMKSRGGLAEQMIKLASQHNKPRFFMGDSLINPYINGLSEKLLANNAQLQFDGYLRADKAVSNPERVEMWARSGLYRARLGLETAAPRMLELMDKRTTPESMLAALKNLTKQGVRTTSYWVVGFPGETEQDFQETLDFIREAYPYLYELEAHPYYYYPYGQVSSRLFESIALYPDEVTDVIKFKVWDVADSIPARTERFDRLTRMAALASSLNIPNIYSMSEYFEAESRWSRIMTAA